MNADPPVLTSDFDFNDPTCNIAQRYQDEFAVFCQISDENQILVHWKDYPVTMSFAFLIWSLSRPVLILARRFPPVPSEFTLHRHFGDSLNRQEVNLQGETRVQA
jgi:hypothetical protein